MRVKKLRHAVFLSCFAFITYACNLEFFDNAEYQEFQWNPSLAVPVGEISYTVSDLFQELNDPNAAITTNAENVVTLLFVEELSAQEASSFLGVQDQVFASSLDAGITAPPSPIATTLNLVENFDFDMSLSGSELLDSLFFSGGNFDISVTSTIQSSSDFTLTIPSLRDKITNAPLVVTGALSPSNPTFTSNNNLSDFKGVFSDDGLGGTTSNKVIMGLEYQINVEVGDALNASDGLDFSLSFTNPEFSQIFGYVGQDELDLNSQSIDLDFFSSFENGTIRFADPKFTFNFDNSFGFPIGIDFRNVIATNSSGVDLALSGVVTDNPQIVQAPTIAQIGESVKSEITLEVANSNIDDLVSHKPTRMTFDVVAQTNPPNGPVQANFLDANSFLDVDIEVEIPLHIGIDNLTAEESMNFDNGEDLEQVKSVMLRLIIDNGIPMSGDVEMVFRNGTTPVYTITDRPLFDGAPVGANGRVSGPVQTVTDVSLDEAAVTAMMDATNILVRATLSTTGVGSGQDVKLFSDYQMDIKMAMQADLRINSNGN